MFVFVCLLVVFRPTWEFFTHSYTDVTITGEGLQILTYARHSWPLSSASVYSGDLRGPVTFKPIAERLAVELSLLVLTT